MEKPTTMTRLTLVEKDLQNHAKTLSSTISELQAHHNRLAVLEEARHARAIKDARQEERELSLLERLKGIETELEKINSLGLKIVGVILLAIAGAFMTFVLKGGLTL